MARQWTAAQLAAMNTRGRTLLVSAAAGSGKTATLTERIIRRLTDPENPGDISRMLIVTFTRAAAAELRERISGALNDAIAAHPDSRHLQEQLLRLGAAHICTIDAFCMEPLRTHFAEAGLPASFRIADEAELAPLCGRVMDDLIDTFYRKYAPESRPGDTVFSMLEGNDFADLCDALTPARRDDGLPDALRGLYEKLLTYPDGRAVRPTSFAHAPVLPCGRTRRNSAPPHVLFTVKHWTALPPMKKPPKHGEPPMLTSRILSTGCLRRTATPPYRPACAVLSR